MSRKNRLTRRNPDGISLPREAGSTLLATAVGVAAAVGIEKLANDMKKGGTGADKDAPFYSSNGVSAVTGGVGVAIGLALHIKGVAPRVGKALIAGSTALAASRYVAHRKDTDAQKAARLPGSRGVDEFGRVRFHLLNGITISPALEGTLVTINGSRFGSAYGAAVQRSGQDIVIYDLPSGHYKIEVSIGGRVTDRTVVDYVKGTNHLIRSTMAQNDSQEQTRLRFDNTNQSQERVPIRFDDALGHRVPAIPTIKGVVNNSPIPWAPPIK